MYNFNSIKLTLMHSELSLMQAFQNSAFCRNAP